MERRRHRTLVKCQVVSTKQTNYLLTFGVGRGTVDARRAFVSVEYISSDELGDLARLG
jgi:hypothetical protein